MVLLANLLKLGVGKDECKSVNDSEKLLKERLADPSKIPVENRKEFEQMTQAQKDNVVDYMRLVGDVCRSNSLSSKQALRDYMVKDEAGTCRVGTNQWKETFQRQANSSGSVWISSGEPQGICRVVQLNRFEPDTKSGTFFWKYVARKAVTNPSGDMPVLGKCSGLDEATYEYSWKSRELFLGCTRIKFSVY
jgi:hypothetical protein